MARKLCIAAMAATLSATSLAQVPDLVTSIDAGGRAMGVGGSSYVTGADTLSSYFNPAGLGYLSRSEVGLTIRNMPESQTVVTGDLVPSGNERLESNGKKGPNGLGHLGFALPLNGGQKGTIGIAITDAGQMRDRRIAGTGLTEGGIAANGYNQLLKNKTDFINLSYGKATPSGFNFGFGLIYARNNTVNIRVGVPSGSTIYDEESSGWGGIVGLMFTPRNNPNISIGMSYRSEISLKSNSGNILLYDKVPARANIGAAIRRDGLRGGKDFLVLSGEVNHFFDGSPSVFFDREAQTTGGLGMEYNYGMGGNRIPIRIGFNFVPSGGQAYAARNSFTYGIGYRAGSGDWGVDLNFGRPQGGGADASLSLMYRFK